MVRFHHFLKNLFGRLKSCVNVFVIPYLLNGNLAVPCTCGNPSASSTCWNSCIRREESVQCCMTHKVSGIVLRYQSEEACLGHLASFLSSCNWVHLLSVFMSTRLVQCVSVHAYMYTLVLYMAKHIRGICQSHTYTRTLHYL